jgi:hypothetical protein
MRPYDRRLMRETEGIVVLEPFRATLSVSEAADANCWRQALTIEPGEKHLCEEIYEAPEADTTVRAIDDHFVQVVFAAVIGSNRIKLRSSVDSLTDDELSTWWKSADAKERAYSVRAFAAISPDAASGR